MSDSSISVTSTGDRCRVAVGSAVADLDLAALDRHIRELAQYRLALGWDEPDPQNGNDLRVVGNPRVLFGRERGELQLVIREPSFGWMSFSFAREQADRMAAAFGRTERCWRLLTGIAVVRAWCSRLMARATQ